METRKKRYVQVGVGGRARFFYESLASTYRETSELTGFCDVNRGRMEYAVRKLKEKYDYPAPALYGMDEFERMILEQKPDYVIVTSIDRTHHKYIAKAMEMGCDVISEKPMTIDVEKCEYILDAVEETGRNLRVTFNYRYAPHHSKIRELMMNNVIGKVTSVHFEWLLSTKHGGDYFRRWHRDKRNSGGLLVHKATHHFDLVNFWLGTYPKTVYAQGDLLFYGRANAEERGLTKFYSRVHGSPNAEGDPFAIKLESTEQWREMYLNVEDDDGYIRDKSVFSDDISIEDTMGVIVRYQNGAIMTYNLNAYCPYEGLRVTFTGTEGRIEYEVNETIYANAGGDKNEEGALAGLSIKVFPMFGEAYDVTVEKGEGGHGGGDLALLEDMFGNPEPDPLHRAASHVDGAMSILTGICANKSIATGMPVHLKNEIDLRRLKGQK